MIPCRHDPPGATLGCRYCGLWRTEPRCRAAWGGPGDERPSRLRSRPATGRLPDAPHHSYHSPPEPTDGPGTELKALLASLGLAAQGCRCEDRVRMMNAWGLRLCRENREDVVGWLREEAARRGWREKLAAGLRAVASGLAGRLDLLDPYPGVVDEALRRYEERAGGGKGGRETP